MQQQNTKMPVIGLSPAVLEKRLPEEAMTKGKELFFSRRLSALQMRGREISAVVNDDKVYTVTVSLDEYYCIDYIKCSCLEYTPELCGHCAAMLLALSTQEWQRRFFMLSARSASESMTTAMDMSISQTFPIRSEWTLTIGSEDFAGAKLSLRIGDQKLYSVRSITSFLSNIKEGKSISFGKGFVFQPGWHSFSQDEQKLMDYMTELSSWHSTNDPIFSGKYALLPDSCVGRVLDLLQGMRFNLIVGDREFPDTEISTGRLPVQITFMSRGEGELLARTSAALPVIPLTNDFSYVLFNDTVYPLKRTRHLLLKPFLRQLAVSRNPFIRFDAKQSVRIFSEAIPRLETIADIQYDDKLNARIVREPLQAQVYLDKLQRGIGARVVFKYGPVQFNPFSAVNSTSGDMLVMRKSLAEEEVLEFLAQYRFMVRKDEAYLLDDDYIGDFIYTGLPALQNIAEVFYSESFKNVRALPHQQAMVGFRLRMDGLIDCDLSIEGVDPQELAALLRSLREKKRYFRLKNGAVLSLTDPSLTQLNSAMETAELSADNDSGSFVMPLSRALQFESLLDKEECRAEYDEGFAALLRSIVQSDRDTEPPESLGGIMRSYQKKGFSWLVTLASCGLGGILADDMGLGKTLQMLALLKYFHDKDGSEPSMVITPTSLMYNWLAEVKKFTPDLDARIISGPQPERVALLKKALDEGVDLIITSYPLIRRDSELYTDTPFRFVLLDEAQHIKNPGSLGAKAVKSLQARARFAMTGTPIENSINDLWSIFDFALPGYLSSHARFVQEMETPIARDGDTNARTNLRRRIKPFILRRIKSEVLTELPDKIETTMYAEMFDEQKAIYLNTLEQIKANTTRLLDEGFSKNRMQILAGITRLRQICCEPSLYLENYTGGSGKLALLLELTIEAIDSGHRLLIFSQFTAMLSIIQEKFNELRIPYQYLDGNVSAIKRAERIAAFNNGEGKVFLISLRAGGTGFNLTSADMIVHFDPWWNPAAEDQATDRAYRIGQTRSVQVIHMLAAGSIEERILALQEKKRALTKAIITEGGGSERLTEDDIRWILNDK